MELFIFLFSRTVYVVLDVIGGNSQLLISSSERVSVARGKTEPLIRRRHDIVSAFRRINLANFLIQELCEVCELSSYGEYMLPTHYLDRIDGDRCLKDETAD